MNLERVWDQEGKEIPLDTDSFFDTGIVVQAFGIYPVIFSAVT